MNRVERYVPQRALDKEQSTEECLKVKGIAAGCLNIRHLVADAKSLAH